MADTAQSDSPAARKLLGDLERAVKEAANTNPGSITCLDSPDLLNLARALEEAIEHLHEWSGTRDHTVKPWRDEFVFTVYARDALEHDVPVPLTVNEAQDAISACLAGGKAAFVDGKERIYDVPSVARWVVRTNAMLLYHCSALHTYDARVSHLPLFKKSRLPMFLRECAAKINK
jgi:hypothetical protein